MDDSSCCALGPEALQERAAVWRSVGHALIGAEATPTGVGLRYRLEPGVAEVLLRLVEAERRCCPSLSLAATVHLSVDGPAETRPWIRETFLEVGSPARPGGQPDAQEIRAAVAEHYARHARGDARVPGCCGTGPDGCGDHASGIGPGVYGGDELENLPSQVVGASLGCANPVAVAGLRPGQTVLDLGSGGGMDVLLSARRVGPTGRAYGLDMTDEMLEPARQSHAEAEIDNAEFLLGRIEAIPLPITASMSCCSTA